VPDENPEIARACPELIMSPRFVVHEHHASHLHYDLRLERNGVLCSWAIPKGPSMDGAKKRLAVAVEDHPLDYVDFEGIIPDGHYGAGIVVVWDSGTYIPADWKPDKVSVILDGSKLKGDFTLIRMKGRGKTKEWLLIKGKDKEAVHGWKIEQSLTAQKRAELIEHDSAE
jgi:bifunctional non-homologous end joining protein LigD